MAPASPAPHGRGPGRPKRRRLSRSAEFDRVYRDGRSKANRWLVLYTFPRTEGDGPRLGVSVSRKVGGAVERNRVKRVLREAFWELADRLPADHDFVIVARPDARELAERDGTEGIGRALDELVPGGSPADAAAGEG
jgi:ribonuclease P protein component